MNQQNMTSFKIMCHFITATVSKDAAFEKVRAIAGSHQLKWASIENPYVQQQLPDGDGYFLTTRNACDCGTEIGSKHRFTQDYVRKVDVSGHIKSFRKKGWSEEKIARWLKQKEQVKARNKRIKESRDDEIGSEIERWLSFLEAVLKSGASKRIGLLLHFYSKGLCDERIKVRRKEIKRIRKIDSEFLAVIEEDVLYLFTT